VEGFILIDKVFFGLSEDYVLSSFGRAIVRNE